MVAPPPSVSNLVDESITLARHGRRCELVLEKKKLVLEIQTRARNSCSVRRLTWHPLRHPNFFFGRKAIARRSSSAARPMRTAAARIAPLDPQLTSSKREAAEQTV